MEVINSDVFRTYAFWAGVLTVKVMAMSFLTAKARIQKQVFANPEDVAASTSSKDAKMNFADQDVERVRRAHLNDLENVIPFLIIALLYTFTNPPIAVAGPLFKIFGLARIIHSIVYAVYPVPQPTRFLACFIGVIIQLYMAFQVIGHFW